MAKRRSSSLDYRLAQVVVPGELVIPEYLKIPDIPDTLPEPHNIMTPYHASYRLTPMAHHRIVIDRIDTFPRFRLRRVKIPISRRNFVPFVSTWTRDGNYVRIINYNNATVKTDRMMNRKMHDWKHPDRDEIDDSRANAMRALNYKSPKLAKYMMGAFHTDDPKIIADSALVLSRYL